MTPPSRKSRPSAISSIGLTGAPSAAATVAPPPEQQVDGARRLDASTSSSQDASTPLRHDASTPNRLDASTSISQDAEASRRPDASTSGRRGATQVPADEDMVAFTLRLTPDEALDLDELQLDLRRALRRRVDKARILRTLLTLAADDPALRGRVAERL